MRSAESGPPLKAVCVAVTRNRDWRWLADAAPEAAVRWSFVRTGEPGWLDKRILRPNLLKMRTSLRAVRTAQREGADLIVSHEADLTFWCAVFQRLLGVRTRHVAYSFNFPFMPSALRLWVMRRVLRDVAEFVVYSRSEAALYAERFGVPAARLRFTPWRMATPSGFGNAPMIPGRYVCAIGGFGRDYGHLVAAARRLPHVRVVIVARRKEFPDAPLPPNVEARFDTPLAEAFNILAFADFAIVPLAGADVACGHITLVAGMLLGKATVATASSGVVDYAREGETALTYPAMNAAKLADRIANLWDDTALRTRLAATAQRFAHTHCSETAALADYRAFIATEMARARA